MAPPPGMTRLPIMIISGVQIDMKTPSNTVLEPTPVTPVSFADGHVSYIRICWNAKLDMTTCGYNPPTGYDYKWSGD